MITAGYHYILEMGECPPDLLDDASFVEAALSQAVRRADLTLIQAISHKYSPQGVTAIAMLAESHLSIHTWPELCYVAVDLFTCGDENSAREACFFLIEAFKPKQHSLQMLVRGSAGSRMVRVHTDDELPVIVTGNQRLN